LNSAFELEKGRGPIRHLETSFLIALH